MEVVGGERSERERERDTKSKRKSGGEKEIERDWMNAHPVAYKS